VAHIDVLPTLVELCGLKRAHGPELHGRSLKPLLESARSNWPDRTLVVDSQRMEYLQPWRRTAVMTDRWRLVNNTIDGDPRRLELYDIRKDPRQQHDLSSTFPNVVGQLKSGYEMWWKATSGRANDFVRIVLGNAAENPSRLTAHDWHGEAAEQIWNQQGIRLAPGANGFWAVQIDRMGQYRFELRRWPKEVDLPINAPFQDSAFNRESTPGRAIAAVKARLKIADVDATVAVQAGDRAAVFTVRLNPGPAKLETWLYDKDGTERGAYFVYAERLDR